MEIKMKYSIIIDKERDEEVIIYAKERGELVERIEALLRERKSDVIVAVSGNDTVMLGAGDIICFTVVDGATYALTEKGKYKTKMRLYQAEEDYGSDILKINQSCLVRVSAIERFSASIGGSLIVHLKGGYKDYVSRRQMKMVKERMGL